MDGYFPKQDINLADFPAGLPDEVERFLGLETGSTKKQREGKGKTAKSPGRLSLLPYRWKTATKYQPVASAAIC